MSTFIILKNAPILTEKSRKLFFWRTKENRGLEEQELKLKLMIRNVEICLFVSRCLEECSLPEQCFNSTGVYQQSSSGSGSINHSTLWYDGVSFDLRTSAILNV